MSKSTATAEQISEARDWLADQRSVTGTTRELTGHLTDTEVIERVSKRYPGGWEAFVEECCTYVYVQSDEKAEREALEDGRSRGWSHANFSKAYGRDVNESPEVPPRHAGVGNFYLSGWLEGVQNFKDGLYEDETPVG